jgi:hypothetical protein
MSHHVTSLAPIPRAPVALAALLAVAACAGGPQVATGPQSNPSGARGILAAASTQGPVPLVIDDVPDSFPGGASQIAGTASNAVSWLGASFVPRQDVPADQRRLVFRFGDNFRDPAATCSGKPMPGAPATPPLELFAVLCDGTRPVADATGTAAGDSVAAGDQLVTAVTDRLFPGNSTTGYSNSIPGVSIGVGVGSGGWGNNSWGLGGGLFF